MAVPIWSRSLPGQRRRRLRLVLRHSGAHGTNAAEHRFGRCGKRADRRCLCRVEAPGCRADFELPRDLQGARRGARRDGQRQRVADRRFRAGELRVLRLQRHRDQRHCDEPAFGRFESGHPTGNTHRCGERRRRLDTRQQRHVQRDAERRRVADGKRDVQGLVCGADRGMRPSSALRGDSHMHDFDVGLLAAYDFGPLFRRCRQSCRPVPRLCARRQCRRARSCQSGLHTQVRGRQRHLRLSDDPQRRHACAGRHRAKLHRTVLTEQQPLRSDAAAGAACTIEVRYAPTAYQRRLPARCKSPTPARTARSRSISSASPARCPSRPVRFVQPAERRRRQRECDADIDAGSNLRRAADQRRHLFNLSGGMLTAAAPNPTSTRSAGTWGPASYLGGDPWPVARRPSFWPVRRPPRPPAPFPSR